MAFQIVVTDTLTDEMVRAGEQLIQSLDANGFPVRAAFWYYLRESEVWRLVIASPIVSQLGPTVAYRQIHNVVDEMATDAAKISLNDITVVENDNHRVSLLRAAVGPKRKAAGIRLSQNVINGLMIDDAYIYRL